MRSYCHAVGPLFVAATTLLSTAAAQPVFEIPGAYVQALPTLGTAPDVVVVRVSRDGTRAQVRIVPGTVSLVIDTRTGVTLFDTRQFAAPDRSLHDVVLTPDGRSIVYGEGPSGQTVGRTIRTRDIDTGQDRLVGTTPTNVHLEDATDGAQTVAYIITGDAAPPRVGVLGPQLPAREFGDQCPDGSQDVAVGGPVQLTGGGLIAVYARLSQSPTGPLSSQITRIAVGVTTGGTGWCRASYDATVYADPFATRAVGGLWATVARGLPPTGPGIGTLVHLYTAIEVPVAPSFHRTRPHRISENGRFVLFTGSPTPALHDGLYVLDRTTGVIEAIVPARPGLPSVVLTSVPLLSGDGNTVIYSAVELDATGVPARPATTFVASVDGDADDQFDAWELTYGLSPSTRADALTDPDGDQVTSALEFAAGTHPLAVPVRLFAESAHGAFFSTSVALFNTTETATTVNVRFLGPFSETVSHPVVLPARRAAFVDVDDLALPFSEFGIVVEGLAGIVAERRMTWSDLTYGSHSGTGVDAPATVWHFAEGATIAGFQTFFLLQNSNATEARTTIRYLLADGTTQDRQHVVPPRARLTVWANQEGGPMAAAEFGATITSALPIVTERAMYRDAPGEAFSAGSVASGVATLATSWFFAEGATGAFFDTYLLLANPGDVTATVDVEFLRAHDPADVSTAWPIARRYVVAPRSRQTIWIRQEDPALADTQVGTRLQSTVPIVAERTMWWPGPTAATWRESHAEVGATSGGQRWAVADLQADTLDGGWDTFLLVATTEQALATIRVAVSCEDGTSASRDMALSVNRTTLWMRHEFPHIVGRRCAATIESLPTRVTSSPSVPLMRTPVVVEKAMYYGTDFRAGSATLATRLPDP